MSNPEITNGTNNGTNNGTTNGTANEDDEFLRGVSKLWVNVNHIALVVSDVGLSLDFYTNIIGMKQILRPNFDRHGAWLTAGNVDIHLIKGRPAVHSDDDLIVSHVALDASNMDGLRARLTKLGAKSRKNISVPNPQNNNKAVDQVNGYYIEFCNCGALDEFLHQTPEGEKDWNLTKANAVASASKVMKKMASSSKINLKFRKTSAVSQTGSDGEQSDSDEHSTNGDHVTVDEKKLANLTQRRKVYGDITQNTVNEKELEELLVRYNNHVPKVIRHLEERMWRKGTQTYIPPAFYDRDGTFYQPPSFEMKITNLDNGPADTIGEE
ncbi:hypothetical protein TCAL_04721 [Tigriopus californicus]|uniref:VOC domain-containing protein n=1 Tax=Tigriopus californicus TaxID=6832 RepID=A0A553PTD1_TIGCA|nr:hypothetical protein TCAL_04721 [Tigriopus californicus]